MHARLRVSRVTSQPRPAPPPAPAVLRLAELLVRGRWESVAEGLYREVAALAQAGPGVEVLVSGCGDGITPEWLAARTGAAVTGVDGDRARIAEAEARARATQHRHPTTYEHAPLDDLPFETGVFDCALGAPGIAAAADPARALRELVRVTKPWGTVLLIQPAWTSELSDRLRTVLTQRLGVLPRHVVEWKRALREAGVVEIEAQDWGAGGQPLSRMATGAHDAIAAPELTWRHKMQIVGHEWRRLGLRGTREAVAREEELLRELARDRALALVLFSGVKWPHGRPG